MPPVQCFFIQPTDRIRRQLRRYGGSVPGSLNVCPVHGHYHNAQAPLDTVQDYEDRASGDEWPHDDPRWPRVCDCGNYTFVDSDNWQLWTETIYRDEASGREMTIRDAPPGAMWYADWMLDHRDYAKYDYGNMYKGPDGHCLVVKCPDGHTWMVDDRASNCTRKDDNVHKCWVRHGTPPLITVDKNGDTCAAGAGSIQTPKWHGFLTNGILSETR